MADFNYVVADDPDIDNDERLLRRVPNWHNWIVSDGGLGLRPSSMAFDRDRDGGPMSVYTWTRIEQLEIPHAALLPNEAEWAVARVTAGQARARDQHVAHELGDEGKPYDEAHAVVDGPPKKTNKLAKDAVWVVPPPAGWYPDPPRRNDERFWDGAAWTNRVRSLGVERVDPL